MDWLEIFKYGLTGVGILCAITVVRAVGKRIVEILNLLYENE